MDYKALINRMRYNNRVSPDDIEDAATAIETLLAERGALISELHEVADCRSCKFYGGDTACVSCDAFLSNWEWCGPQKEGKHEAD